MLWLFLLFVVTPFVELTLLLVLTDYTSWQTTLLVVLVTGVAGSWLARSQGLRTIRRIQAELRQGRMPTEALADGAMILAAGVLLLTPGLLTDALGLSLLAPPCRRYYRRRLLGWFQRRVVVHTAVGPAPASRSEVIDARVVHEHKELP